MALKMDRLVDATEVGYFCNSVLNRGVVVSVVTAGSGVALDSPTNICGANAVASGSNPIGILLQDVVSIDLTRVPLNWYKDQTNVGNKVTILTKGWVVTNAVLGTPSGGQLAQLAASGNIQAVPVGTASTLVAPIVGRFRSGLDEAGYAKVYIDL